MQPLLVKKYRPYKMEVYLFLFLYLLELLVVCYLCKEGRCTKCFHTDPLTEPQGRVESLSWRGGSPVGLLV